MHFSTLKEALGDNAVRNAKGPIAMIFAEDRVELASTIAHNQKLGFKSIFVFVPQTQEAPLLNRESDHIIRYQPLEPNAVANAVSAINNALAPKTWSYFCFNAEYLFFPFCETRSIGELLAFHTEERRDAMLTYVIDLYAEDLTAVPNAVSLDNAHLDRTGYFALARRGERDEIKERQLDFFGGLRWRFEEHIPPKKRKIDRIGLFKTKAGLTLRPDYTFSDEEYNTYSCQWHHNLTAAICSFRTAKALTRNPGSMHDIHSFKWRNSEKFEWNSKQLLDLGLIEPGQWF